MASAPPKTLIKAPGVKVFLERYCSTGDQTLVVKNSLILGVRFGMSFPKQNYSRAVLRPRKEESAGQLKVEQSSFIADDNRQYDPIFAATKSSSILIDDSSSFRCPSGRKITIEKITEEDGFELVKETFGKRSKTCWIRVQYIKLLCEECPDVNRTSSTLKFIPCPLEYCKTPTHSTTQTYNGCYGSRTGSIGCPFPGFTVVTKELFFCLKFLATLLSIPLIYTIHRAISRWKHSVLAVVAVLTNCLHLGICHPPCSRPFLGIADAFQRQSVRQRVPDIWWQYLQIVFILAFIIPLVLVLFWGSLMLSKDKLSAKEFLTSCAFPLPFLFIWLFRYCKRKEDTSQYEYLPGNSKDTDDIKRVLYDPFRTASDGDHGTLYWESVLVGRRFLLLTISTFITDPLTRFVCLGIACVLILAHHLLMRPFRDRKANICESLSLVSLTAICTFNLAKVTIIAQGLEPAGPKQILFHALKWIEVALLGFLPAMAFILVVLVALSQVVRLLYHCVKLLHRSNTIIV
ncbi:hypothetical protein pdam_00005654 [Pocillopora damicornis]|uniref:Uncharacterized protein n=1 Tax=Pocillopora damicornis TaxID=46731 RepID=A0A3M6V617_POCDA|nr:hypothetical protein pdam_00005654 [Pocillopora damicornis]